LADAQEALTAFTVAALWKDLMRFGPSSVS
jgi:hypothetical protein